jgi:hypothetical protein
MNPRSGSFAPLISRRPADRSLPSASARYAARFGRRRSLPASSTGRLAWSFGSDEVLATHRCVGQCFPQLLNNPIGCRMPRDIEVQNPAAAVFDHKEAVKQPECHSGHGEEVKGDNCFPMIPQKRKPLLTRITASAGSSQVSRHRSFRYDETQFLNLAVDSRRSPLRVLSRNPLNEFPYLAADPRATTPRTGTPTPVETKTGTVPADYRLWFHDQEDIAPSRPQTPKRGPE